MKKQIKQRKLNVGAETVRRLVGSSLSAARGGHVVTDETACDGSCVCRWSDWPCPD